MHDPSLTGEKEVRAQVKLSFRSTVGESFVVTRSVQLSVNKKGGRSQSTKDCTLVMRSAGGERTSMSNRVADVDVLVPERLGVSHAVLDFVVFCHQDESLWPMSEPLALKKKFDEIFEAQQYTKAIDQLNIIKKKQGELQRQYESDERLYKDSKEKGERNERNRARLKREIGEHKAEFEDLTHECKNLLLKIQEKHEQKNSHSAIVESLRAKTEQHEFKRETAEELRSRIDELRESDEELTKTLNEYEDRLSRICSEAKQKTAQCKEIQTSIAATRREQTQKVSEQGKHQSDKEQYERQIVVRKKMVRDAAERHEIRGFDGELGDRLVQSFQDRIKKILADKKRELERLQHENAMEVDQAAGRITELESRKQSQYQIRSSAKQRIKNMESQMATIQKQLGNLDVDEGEEAKLQVEMKDLEARLEQARAAEREAGLDQQIKQETDNIRFLKVESESLSRELVECTRLAADRAQLDLRKKELLERRRGLESIVSTWKQKLSAVLGEQWRPEAVESDYQAVNQEQNSAVTAAQKRKDATQQDLGNLEFRLSTAQQRHKKLEADYGSCKDSVLTALSKVKDVAKNMVSVDDFDVELTSAEVNLKQTSTDIRLYDEMKKFWVKVEKTANTQSRCHFCEHSFHGDELSKSRLFKKITKNLGNEAKEELLEDQAEIEGQLSVLQGVRTRYDTYRRLEKELPPLLEEIRALEAQKESLVRQLEDEDQVFREAGEKMREVESILKTVTKISQACKDIGESEQKIEKIASQQSSSSTTRSPDEINELQGAKADQIKSAENKLEKLVGDRQRLRDSISSLELDRSELRNRIATVTQQLGQKKSLQDQVQQKKKEILTEREATQQADAELENLEPQIAEARAIRDEKSQQARLKEQEVADSRDEIASSINELRRVDQDIQDYIDRGGPENLASNFRAMSSLDERLARLEKELQQLTVQVSELREQEANSDRLKENISNNLRLRKNIRDLDRLRREIAELESRNAQEDLDRLAIEAESLEAKRTKLFAERSRLGGVILTKNQTMEQLEEEFEQEYADAKAKYREAHVKVQTSKMAIKDLQDYAQALERAIMQYHTLKMDEVNRTVGELWQNTYRGTDIDAIMIRSDIETPNDSKQRRNYNYRVCMVKGDVEMDMRGRCSAGQKVLASIIIRLALAESFGVNCGLIALDEPTTNLDVDNIRSLAESLHAIINARRAQANLQLIIITHDEEFLKHMQCGDFCEYFFRVKRDAHQNSVIVRENITQIMEG